MILVNSSGLFALALAARLAEGREITAVAAEVLNTYQNSGYVGNGAANEVRRSLVEAIALSDLEEDVRVHLEGALESVNDDYPPEESESEAAAAGKEEEE